MIMLEAHDIDLGWMAFFYSSSLTNIAHKRHDLSHEYDKRKQNRLLDRVVVHHVSFV